MQITLRQLRYFQALATERHFARAAERVAVSQPALSGQIAALEEALGGPLVQRGQPGLPLTPLGRAVLARAESVLAEARAIESLARAGAGLSAPLRLGMIPTVAPYLVPALVPLIRAEGASISIREAVTAVLMEELGGGRIDAAVIALPPDRPGLETAALFRDPFLLAMPAGAAPVPERPEEIPPARLLLLDEGHCLTGQALSACGLRPTGGQVSLGAASLGTLARLVASGEGVTLMPRIAAAAEAPGLALHRFAAPEPEREIGLAALAGSSEAPWFPAVAALLRAAAEAVPAPPLGAAEPPPTVLGGDAGADDG